MNISTKKIIVSSILLGAMLSFSAARASESEKEITLHRLVLFGTVGKGGALVGSVKAHQEEMILGFKALEEEQQNIYIDYDIGEKQAALEKCADKLLVYNIETGSSCRIPDLAREYILLGELISRPMVKKCDAFTKARHTISDRIKLVYLYMRGWSVGKDEDEKKVMAGILNNYRREIQRTYISKVMDEKKSDENDSGEEGSDEESSGEEDEGYI